MANASRPITTTQPIIVPALRTAQGKILLYAFFLEGKLVTQIADIRRVSRTKRGKLEGFQRASIQKHVRQIAEYLKHGDVLFPNAIILGISSDVRFELRRGPKKTNGAASSGYLHLEARQEGERLAWIVDGQQRSMAMASSDTSLPVPVVAFVADTMNTFREQFILLNKAKPLPNRLIEELLPATQSVLLPKELNAKKIPSKLCDLLNQDDRSPFYGLIRRASTADQKSAIVIDSAVTKMIRERIEDPLGALALRRGLNGESAQVEAMYADLCEFWTAVKKTFPNAWGLPTEKSRLMHSAGIQSMGKVMDRIFARHQGSANANARKTLMDLKTMAPYCRWTEGTWEGIGRAWNEIESTGRDINLLKTALMQIYARQVRY